ncbi:hypothetical protein BGZ58_002109, partial [Dissophora ornata]
MAVAVVAIAREHGYSKQQQGLILASFFFGYILTPIMGGTLADRYGGKSILAIDSEGEIQAASSCVQSSSDENDLVYRADAVAPLPTSAKDSRWQAFRNRMRSKKLQEQRGLRRGDKVTVPWKELLTRREVWAIILSQSDIMQVRAASGQNHITVQNDYDRRSLYMPPVLLLVVPSAVQGIMGLFAGYLGDKATQDWHWSTLTVRRVGQSLGSLGLGVFLLVAVNFAHTAASAMVLITIGMALNGFTMIGASTYQ